ncbi:hypothetical protein MAR_022417, partial [Mya arenaria]
ENAGAAKVLAVVDNFVQAMTNTLDKSENKTTTIKTPNLGMSSFSTVVYKNLSGILTTSNK